MCSFVIGRYNVESNASNNNGARFIVGNGTGDNARSNAFAVYANGYAEIQKQGITDNSIVIKSTLDTSINTLNNVLIEIRDAIQNGGNTAQTIE